jgi:low temperature requirement protein LtrA
MFGVAVLATTVPGVFDGATIRFPLAYVGVRSVLLVLYERARRHVPEARFDTDFWLRIATLALALALIPPHRSPLATLVVLAGALVAQVAYELARHEGHAHQAEIQEI